MTTEETITITRRELARVLANLKFFPDRSEGHKVRMRHPHAVSCHIFRGVNKARAEAEILDQELPVSKDQIGPQTGLRPGQKVRVTFTGIVETQTPQETIDEISPVTEATTGSNIYVPERPDGTGYEVEVVETYEKDAVYLDAQGAMFLHQGRDFPSWTSLPSLHVAGWNVPVRPLVKLTAKQS